MRDFPYFITEKDVQRFVIRVSDNYTRDGWLTELLTQFKASPVLRGELAQVFHVADYPRVMWAHLCQ